MTDESEVSDMEYLIRVGILYERRRRGDLTPAELGYFQQSCIPTLKPFRGISALIREILEETEGELVR